MNPAASMNWVIRMTLIMRSARRPAPEPQSLARHSGGYLKQALLEMNGGWPRSL
jgi:hypothetical protein